MRRHHNVATEPTDTPIEFDPVARGLDLDGDNIYHFTTITIGAGITVRLTVRKVNAPVFWLASGAVQMNGAIDLNGDNGQDAVSSPNTRLPTFPGVGGYGGGIGGNVNSPAQPGGGPGGGASGVSDFGGNGTGGSFTGNVFLVPLIGGSGGGGGQHGTTDPSWGATGGAGVGLC
jgi:hypothetical protein